MDRTCEGLTPFEQGALAVACELVPREDPMRMHRISNAVTTAVVRHAAVEQTYSSAPQLVGAAGEIK